MRLYSQLKKYQKESLGRSKLVEFIVEVICAIQKYILRDPPLDRAANFCAILARSRSIGSRLNDKPAIQYLTGQQLGFLGCFSEMKYRKGI